MKASLGNNREPAVTEGIKDNKSMIGVFLRGCAMGAADIVPGISGGTIALISGIYERLLTAISSVPNTLLGVVKHRQLKRFWHELDGTFLIALLLGILTSVVLMAGLVKYLLAHHPILLWSFFFGLILAAIVHVGRQIGEYSAGVFVALLLGTAVSFGITLLAPAQMVVTGWTVFAAGAIAICAMILPGISGSFILVLMGMYAPVIDAVDDLNLSLLALFICGCILGLLLFSRLIAWGLRRFHPVALALLTGFMVGSLNKVWPWKVTTEWGQDRHGNSFPLVQENVWPLDYAFLTGELAHLFPGLALAVTGVMLVLALERWGNRKHIIG